MSKITQGWLVGVLGNRELVGETEMKCHFIYKVSICLRNCRLDGVFRELDFVCGVLGFTVL